MPVTKSQVWFGRMFTAMPRIQLKDDEQGFPISCFISAVELWSLSVLVPPEKEISESIKGKCVRQDGKCD